MTHQLHHLGAERADRLICRPRVEHARGLGRERRILEIRRQRQVHFSAALAQQPRFVVKAAVALAVQQALDVLPGVPAMRDVLLQHAHHRVLAAPAAVDDRAHDGRDVSEAGAVREEARHLEVGMDAVLQAPEDLQDQALAEDDRVVALLGAGQRWRQLGLIVAQALEQV